MSSFNLTLHLEPQSYFFHICNVVRAVHVMPFVAVKNKQDTLYLKINIGHKELCLGLDLFNRVDKVGQY